MLRAFIVLFALHLSGAAHFVADAWEHVDCSAECGHEATSDDDEQDCPPGCPSCHACSHRQAVAPSAIAAPIGAPMVVESVFVHATPTHPPRGERTSIDRPPRA